MAHLVGIVSCQLQKNKNMETNNNPLLCDPTSGVCELPDSNSTISTDIPKSEKAVKIIYFTDPICSSCWGIEPQLRKLKLEYGNAIEIEYRMGGLLPDWSYNSGGISKPSDVAHHWDEVSRYYDMPIDGDVWLEDPLPSSYPPSIAFKAAQLQSEEKALLFLREIREQVFLQKKNITKWEYLESAARKTGLNLEQLKSDYNNQAKSLFEEDLALAKSYGVRGFPTMFFVSKSNQKEMVYGSKPYAYYEAAIHKLNPVVSKINYDNTWKSLFSSYSSLTANEFAQLSGVARMESEKILNQLAEEGHLTILKTKNGSLWTLKKQ
jgi:predicted DsbA family dithiol-disulfide isomerase